MIVPTESDIGRKVVYRDWSGKPEEGVITSLPGPDAKLDTPCCFVRYGTDPHGKLTPCRHLEWLS